MAAFVNGKSQMNTAMTRRDFLRLAAGGLVGLVAGPRLASMAVYKVGLGNDTDAYSATERAVDACGEWPGAAMAGKKVVIKPNLVAAMQAGTGITTDPEVVRALVDRALAVGAAQVLIVESGPGGANFTACGYGFFGTYDPGGRVTLVDLNDEPAVLTEVPGGGMAYMALYMPELLLEDDVVLISAAKLKCHFHTLATLSMKNLMGSPPVGHYSIPPEEWRFAMHRRGISQSIVDINLVRPIDFAVVDGIVGREGNGPVGGKAVALGLVVAGRNPVAVDRTCLWATTLPQDDALHLTYAAQRGLGPASMDEIDREGDPFTPHTFTSPSLLPPILEYPQANPQAFAPCVGQRTEITYTVHSRPACETRVEIIQTSESSPEESLIRTLHDWRACPSGGETVEWDGRDDGAALVSPGRYTARAQARYSAIGTMAYATGWVWVARHEVYLPAVHKTAN